MPENDALLISLIRDLSIKLDQMPTRHEFEALTARIDTFVLKSEFETYKELNDRLRDEQRQMAAAQMQAVVPRAEHEQRWRDDDHFKQTTARKLQSIEGKMGRLPSWMVNLIIGIICAIIGGLSSSAVIFHQSSTSAH